MSETTQGETQAKAPAQVCARSHMDCFTSPNNCWLGTDETCPMSPGARARRRETTS